MTTGCPERSDNMVRLSRLPFLKSLINIRTIGSTRFGRPVYSCHPKRVEPIVRMLISDFKKGKRDSLTILSERSGHPVVINYFALRDDDGTYLGTLEAVQIIDGLADAIRNNKKGPIDL